MANNSSCICIYFEPYTPSAAVTTYIKDRQVEKKKETIILLTAELGIEENDVTIQSNKPEGNEFLLIYVTIPSDHKKLLIRYLKMNISKLHFKSIFQVPINTPKQHEVNRAAKEKRNSEYHPGDKVKVNVGSLKGMHGVVMNYDTITQTVTVKFQMFANIFNCEKFPLSQIEKIIEN